MEPRTVRCVGMTDRLRFPPPASGFSWASNMDTATRPACSMGELMVVRGGLQKSAPKDVVAAHDAHVLRHPETTFAKPLQHADSDEVIEDDARSNPAVNGGICSSCPGLGLRGGKGPDAADLDSAFLGGF